jgi:hypothetical protein
VKWKGPLPIRLTKPEGDEVEEIQVYEKRMTGGFLELK